MELQQWLNDPNRDYNTGVALYKVAAGIDKYYNYFMQKSNAVKGSPHYNMLINRLSKINRVVRQNGKVIRLEVSQAQPPQTIIKEQSSVKEVIVTKIISQNENDITGLRDNRMYVNKILSLQWKDLDVRDKEVFFNSKEYFEGKRKLFIENSDRERVLKSLHATLKHSKVKKDRAVILAEASELENKNTANWSVIDNWDAPLPQPVIDPIEQAKKDAAAGARKIELLKGYIRRGDNDLKHNKYSDKVKKNKETKLQSWKKELERLENEIA